MSLVFPCQLVLRLACQENLIPRQESRIRFQQRIVPRYHGMIIDSYTHCGVSKYHPVDVVSATMQQAGVHRAVLAQHLGEFDNSYIQDVVAENPDRFAGVCLIDHESPSAEEDLRMLAGSPSCQGVRWPIAPDINNLELVGRTLELGLVVVAYFPESIAACVTGMKQLLESHPDGIVVASHLGNPTENQPDPLRDFHQAGVFDLVSASGLVIQLSGMEMTTEFPHQGLHPLVAAFFEAAGPTRLTWGSNFPVVGSAREYLAELQLVSSGQLPIPEEAIPAIVGGNAERIWFDRPA